MSKPRSKKVSAEHVSTVLGDAQDQLTAVACYLEAVRDDGSKRKPGDWEKVLTSCAAYTRKVALKVLTARDDLLS